MKDMERERGGEKEREREGWGERGEKEGEQFHTLVECIGTNLDTAEQKSHAATPHDSQLLHDDEHFEDPKI